MISASVGQNPQRYLETATDKVREGDIASTELKHVPMEPGLYQSRKRCETG